MTSPYEGFKAETKALVENGNNRLEDALACEAARLFLAEVGAVPRAAFGNITDISEKWYREWNDQFTARCTELASIRDALWNAGCGLLKVAGDYEHTDVEAAFIIGDSWSVAATPVGGYLSPLLDHYTGIAYRPGEPFPTEFASAQPSGTLTGGDSLGFPALISGEAVPQYGQEVKIETRPLENALPWEGERHWPWEGDFWEHAGRPTVEVPTVTIAATPGNETDKLVEFVGRVDQGWALALAEAIADFEGADATHPMQDMVVPVWCAAPSIFDGRYVLLKQLSSFMPEILDRVTNQTGRLRTYWEGAGASAYLATDGSGLAPMMINYLTGLSARIEWFSQRARTVGAILRDLRNSYAADAVADVKSVNAANDEYLAAVSGALVAASPDRVANTLKGVFSIYQTARTRETDRFENELSAEKNTIAADRGLHIGELYSEARRFQPPGGGDGWADPGLWGPKPGSSPSYRPE